MSYGEAINRFAPWARVVNYYFAFCGRESIFGALKTFHQQHIRDADGDDPQTQSVTVAQTIKKKKKKRRNEARMPPRPY